MLDARGYSCPMPVILVQKQVKTARPNTLEVLVDNRAAVENVTRFAENQGYAVCVRPDGQEYLLTLTRETPKG